MESRFFHKVFVVFTGLAIISFLISLAGRQIGSEIAMGGHTDSLALHEIVIGNDVLSLPANMIRYPEQRRDGIAHRLDLYARWPNLSGFTRDSRSIFNNLDKDGRLIFISFEQRLMTHDMSGRLEPIYKPMIESEGEKLANGLIRYSLPEKAGFLNEYLYVGNIEGKQPFVARCLGEEASATSLAPCDRDYQSGDGLSMMVRFSPKLLNDWQAFDTALSSFARSSIKGIQ